MIDIGKFSSSLTSMLLGTQIVVAVDTIRIRVMCSPSLFSQPPITNAHPNMCQSVQRVSTAQKTRCEQTLETRKCSHHSSSSVKNISATLKHLSWLLKMKSWMSFWLAIKRSLACEGPNPTLGPTQHRPAAHLHIQTQTQHRPTFSLKPPFSHPCPFFATTHLRKKKVTYATQALQITRLRISRTTITVLTDCVFILK